VQEIGRLFGESETWLALIGGDGAIVATSGPDGRCGGLEDQFAAATAAEVLELVAGASADRADTVHVVRGRTIDDREIEVRVVRSRHDRNYCLAVVRPVGEAALDLARSRVRQLSAALQSVADIVVPIEELQGHEEARRKATLVAPLTERERRVALAVADGVRTSQIANDLFVSQSTVRNYLPSIYRKLGVTTRDGLVALLNSPD
jgi:DNA-binding NarL/FixJ family response regulator